MNTGKRPIKREPTKVFSARKKPEKTSWGAVSGWYDALVEENDDTYQKQVILPNLLRVLELKKGERVLDIACGQGFFSRAFAEAGARVVGVDISPELIIKARERSPRDIVFHIAPADHMDEVASGEFDTAVSVLAVQNIENMEGVFAEARRAVVHGGRLVLVLNHPAFRVLKKSGWGWDDVLKTQYRRVDAYLSRAKVAVVMNPGKTKSEETYSYHRSLQDFFKALSKNGFMVSRLEEWISHKKSGVGPRQKAEDIARKEIPLFLMLEARRADMPIGH